MWFRQRRDRAIDTLIVPPRPLFLGADERLPHRAAQRRFQADEKRREASRIDSGLERPRWTGGSLAVPHRKGS